MWESNPQTNGFEPSRFASFRQLPLLFSLALLSLYRSISSFGRSSCLMNARSTAHTEFTIRALSYRHLSSATSSTCRSTFTCYSTSILAPFFWRMLWHNEEGGRVELLPLRIPQGSNLVADHPAAPSVPSEGIEPPMLNAGVLQTPYPPWATRL